VLGARGGGGVKGPAEFSDSGSGDRPGLREEDSGRGAARARPGRGPGVGGIPRRSLPAISALLLSIRQQVVHRRIMQLEGRGISAKVTAAGVVSRHLESDGTLAFTMTAGRTTKQRAAGRHYFGSGCCLSPPGVWGASGALMTSCRAAAPLHRAAGRADAFYRRIVSRHLESRVTWRTAAISRRFGSWYCPSTPGGLRSEGFLYYIRSYIILSRRREGGGVWQVRQQRMLPHVTWRVVRCLSPFTTAGRTPRHCTAGRAGAFYGRIASRHPEGGGDRRRLGSGGSRAPPGGWF